MASPLSQSSHEEPAEASSSRGHQPRVDDEDDEEQGRASVVNETLLDGSVSFKRKQKASSAFPLSRFFSSPLRNSVARNSSARASPRSKARQIQNQTLRNDSTDAILPYLEGSGVPLTDDDTKVASGLDWYVEGPGRRVGYDDLTAIDWIFEYAKERQRLRVLHSSATGIVGYLRELADASQVWIVLISTGIAAGLVAAFIDVASGWLGDLKTGYCRNFTGGKFYLSKAFCCWGHDEMAKCLDWNSWGHAFGVSARGGSYVIDYTFFIFFSILFAACASFLVGAYANYAKHSGIPEIKTMLGGFIIRRFLGSWTLLIKSLGLCLAVASGLWLGKEGPLVHVACCCANLFMQLSDNISSNEARKREILSAAAAAGISVAFGSPIGGVLFSLEQLSYYFPDKTMWQSFVCAMVAAVTLQAFNPFRTGKLVLYQVTYHSGWHNFELVPFAILGIIGGLYGGLFIKLNMRVAEWRRSSKFFKGPVTEVAVIALITAVINFPIKFMRAQASELVYVLFAECVDITDDTLGLCKSGRANTGVIALLIVAAILGFLLASITFGLQIPAGIILPSMAIGALCGRAVGLVLQVFQSSFPNMMIFRSCEPDIQCVTPGTYAIVGAAAALGGATRMTVSIVVIMFELTGALTYVLPIMIAVMISKWVGDAISKRDIYESWIHFNGYPILDNRDDNGAGVPDVPASQAMARIEDLVVITATGHTIKSLKNLLNTHPFRGFPVIDNAKDAILLGYISRAELEFALASSSRTLPLEVEAYFSHQPLADPTTSLDLRPWMDQTPITLHAKASLQLTVNMFQRLGLRYVLFVDKGSLRGLLTKKDVWFVLNGAEKDREGGEDVSREAVRQEGPIGEDLGLLVEEDEEDSRSAEI